METKLSDLVSMARSDQVLGRRLYQDLSELHHKIVLGLEESQKVKGANVPIRSLLYAAHMMMHSSHAPPGWELGQPLGLFLPPNPAVETKTFSHLHDKLDLSVYRRHPASPLSTGNKPADGDVDVDGLIGTLRRRTGTMPYHAALSNPFLSDSRGDNLSTSTPRRLGGLSTGDMVTPSSEGNAMHTGEGEKHSESEGEQLAYGNDLSLTTKHPKETSDEDEEDGMEWE